MNAFTDWQPHLEEFILQKKNDIKVVLELGLGEGTDTFVKLADMVYSIELLHFPEHEGWFEKMQEKYKDVPNWKGYLHRCEKNEITNGVSGYLNLQVARIKPDFVFVDPGVHFRGDLVNLMMARGIRYIAAHDTRQGFSQEENDIYGWGKIKAEEYGYEVVINSEGQGTTLWTSV